VTGVLEFLDSVPGSVSGKLHRAELPLISLPFCQPLSLFLCKKRKTQKKQALDEMRDENFCGAWLLIAVVKRVIFLPFILTFIRYSVVL
jgi:hypothetical protein